MIGGILGVIAIMIVAGVVAYIGDRVGHQVGRKRLTLFGLRPKYTSTIVAVATGMLIALGMTLVALLVSGYVRTAFFRLAALNNQINALQAQALSQQKELETTRNGDLVMYKGQPVAPFFRLLDLTKSDGDQSREIRAFFDETVDYANRTLTRPPFGLRADAKRSTDPATAALLDRELQQIRDSAAAAQVPGGNAPVLLLPVAAQNLFRGDTITFGFNRYLDRKIASNGETLATVDVGGGAPLSNVEVDLLYSRVLGELARRGYPAAFLSAPVSGFDPLKLQSVSYDLARARGRYRFVAKAGADIYPHNDRFVLTSGLEAAR